MNGSGVIFYLLLSMHVYHITWSYHVKAKNIFLYSFTGP